MMLSVSPSLWCLTVSRHSERGQECFVGKTENGTVTRSEESITLVTAYRFSHHSSRSFTFVQDDALWFFSPWVRILRWRSEWRLVIRRHSALLADGSQLTANSSQLIADSFYLLTVSLTMTPYHPRLFWTGARYLVGKTENRAVTWSEESVIRMTWKMWK